MCIYSYMFKLESSSKYSPFDAYTYQDIFCTVQNSFWTCWFWCHLVLLPFFVLLLPHQQKVSPWGVFHLGKHKKVARGGIWWIGRAGHRDHDIFWVKNCWTLSTVWVGALVHHHEMGKHIERVFQKNLLKQNTASHNNASWYTDTHGFV